MRKPALLASMLVILLGAFAALVLGGKPEPALVRNPLVLAGLQPIGIATPSWQTVVLFASRDTDLSPAKLWATWERLESWPGWSSQLVVEARWLDTPGWRAGARFEQVLDLGFPLNRVHSAETVGLATPGRLVSWWKDEGGIKSNHVWSFEALPDGGCRIVDFEIMHGVLIGLARPLIEQDWQHRFDDAIDGLIIAARRAG
ncbi:MAG: SRPBCC family protein [Pseudomonadota bacterium]